MNIFVKKGSGNRQIMSKNYCVDDIATLVFDIRNFIFDQTTRSILLFVSQKYITIKNQSLAWILGLTAFKRTRAPNFKILYRK